MDPMSDLAIARRATLKPIAEVAAKAGIPADALEPYGKTKAKVGFEFLDTLKDKPRGKLVLVTAINPTAAGEGKTTTTIGLGDALNRIGRRTVIALREPSLGPCFGRKGGATGGGHAQVVPMEDINLHFTGDFHAIGAAHNLLSALIDNHVYWRGEPSIDPRRITWPRVLDMNDRSLRDTVTGLGGPALGVPREARFDITTASEVMAILCLSRDLDDLQARLSRIIVAETFDRKPVTAADVKAVGSMAVLLRDAIKPNLVQTLENNPAFIHGGPFANIAHGCNSIIATEAALRLGEFVVTEAGFGADLGAEKFMDIKCRMAGLAPSAVVIVATVRALKLQGGADARNLKGEDLAALERGMANLERHIENVGKFGVPPLVAINRFATDSEAELRFVEEACRKAGTRAFLCEHWARGGAGAEGLARAVAEVATSGKASFRTLYPDDMPLLSKIETIAREIYRAGSVSAPESVRQRLAGFEAAGFGHVPVCIAKTQSSFSSDPTKLGAPTGHVLAIREARLAAGAGFVVAVCGDLQTMPGLPKVPAAHAIGLDAQGMIEGLS
ncbi:MAG: formate--tetrahydrofolate ligase [Alphaproteobacteria bacterium]